MKTMKKLNKIVSALILPILLTGCFNYTDINKVSFVTSMIFDMDNLGNVEIYLDCIKPYRSTNDSSDKGRRISYKGSGKTALEAIRDLNREASLNFNFQQNKAYIFTERAAKEGLDKYLGLINNSTDMSIRPYMFIYYGQVKDLLEISSKDEEHLGLYLNEIAIKNRKNPKSMECNVNEYLSKTLIPGNTVIIGSLELEKGELDSKVEMLGGAVIKDDVLVDRLDEDDSFIYNMVNGKVRNGTIIVENPQNQEGFITLEVAGCNVEDEIVYENGKYKLIENIHLETYIGESQGRTIYDSTMIKKIKEDREIGMKKYIEDLFYDYKEKDIDIFGLEVLLEKKHSDTIDSNPLQNTEIIVNIDLSIDGTGTVKNTL